MRDYSPTLLLMLRRQDVLNRKIFSDWLERKFPWPRAVRLECAELVESLPWKWWAKKNPDWRNVRLEVVDVWHFMLSWALQEYHDHYQRARDFEDWAKNLLCHLLRAWKVAETPRVTEVIELAETVVEATFRERADQVFVKVACLTGAVGLDFEEVAKFYFGKNALNRFRQDHGIKEGFYRRVWKPVPWHLLYDSSSEGVEDNVFMMNEAEKLETPSDEESLEKFESLLYEAMENFYARLGFVCPKCGSFRCCFCTREGNDFALS